MDKKNGYSFTYSAKQRAEIKRIRDKYTEPNEDKMQELISLDKSVGKKGTVISLVLGILGVLTMGTGMSFVMVWTGRLFIPGLFVGIFGMLATLAAYPTYTYITKKERKRLAPQIIRLSDELLK